jgi:glycosyltransferase involved in cell wall biosynthesis
MMACGCLVVTNRNAHTTWLLRDSENCLLADGSASSLAECVQQGLRDQQLRQRITEAAQDLVLRQYSDWDAQAEKVYQCLLHQS